MRATMLLGPLLAAVVSSACESVPLVAPSQSTVRLAIAAATVPHGGSTAVTATVTEAGGTPVHDGTVVTFSTTLGAVYPPEAPTARGRASATFTAGAESGVADVVAYSGGAVSDAVQVTIGAAAVASVRVTARPGSLPPTGGSAEVVASVLDGARNPLPDVQVAFSATAGSLRDRVATTDRSGEARTVLTTTTAAEVTASVGEISGRTSVAVDSPTTILVRVSPPQPVVGQVVAFDVTLRNPARAIRSAVIAFGDGEVLDLGTAERATATHTYGAAGAYVVTVTATDVAGYAATSSLAVQVGEAPAIPVTISASPASPAAGQAVTFFVDVSPPPNAPEVREVAIDFGDRSSASLGAFSGRRSIAHIYANPGSYIVAAAVRDAAGRRHESSIGMVVTGN